jgi:SAM-dependent methyltransferase
MPTWDELFKRQEHRWQAPHHTVVAFAEALRQRGVRRVLDLGCGAGRHAIYLARKGYDVCATDISATGLIATRDWLATEGLSAGLHLSDMTSLAVADESVDALLTLYVIYHNRLGDIRRTVAEIERILRPGAVALLTLISTRSYRFGQGREIEPGTFIPTTGPDAGLPHHFFDQEGARSLLARFSVSELALDEHEEAAENGRALLHSHWVCLVEKGSQEAGGH